MSERTVIPPSLTIITFALTATVFYTTAISPIGGIIAAYWRAM